MFILERALGRSVLILLLVSACSAAAPDVEDPRDRVGSYALVCTKTECGQQRARCESASDQRCSDCYDACSSPSSIDLSLCLSICQSVCESNCGSCSVEPDRCIEQSIQFPPPPVNPELETEARLWMSQCLPAEARETTLQVIARSVRHEYLDVLRCRLAQKCQNAVSCQSVRQGTVGTALCQRQSECGSPCEQVSPGTLGSFIDDWEPELRPGLVAELRRCAAEQDCAVATACWKALKPALGLAPYPDLTH